MRLPEDAIELEEEGRFCEEEVDLVDDQAEPKILCGH